MCSLRFSFLAVASAIQAIHTCVYLVLFWSVFECDDTSDGAIDFAALEPSCNEHIVTRGIVIGNCVFSVLHLQTKHTFGFTTTGRID